MKRTYLLSAATAVLMASSGFALAQGMNQGGAPAGNAPAAARPGGAEAPMTREAPAAKTPEGMKGGQTNQMAPGNGDKAQRSEDHAPDGMKSSQGKPSDDMKSKAPEKASESETKGGNKAASDTNGKPAAEKSASEMNGKTGDANKGDKNASDNNRPNQTTGQAGAGAKQLSSEQRTSIRTVIHSQNVKPVTNINFSISVGTRVPREVSFHPVPREIVEIYPAYRDYEYFLVRDEIIVVNPRTLEIVAVIET